MELSIVGKGREHEGTFQTTTSSKTNPSACRPFAPLKGPCPFSSAQRKNVVASPGAVLAQQRQHGPAVRQAPRGGQAQGAGALAHRGLQHLMRRDQAIGLMIGPPGKSGPCSAKFSVLSVSSFFFMFPPFCASVLCSFSIHPNQPNRTRMIPKCTDWRTGRSKRSQPPRYAPRYAGNSAW